MSLFLCKLWPYLAGGLIGWLLAGWLARKLKHVDSPSTVQKLVDNPDHLNRIRILEKENAEIETLRSQIKSFEGNTSKTVDNPKHLDRIRVLEKENAEIATLRSQIKSFESSKSKTIDNPDHLDRIRILEKENAEIETLRSQLKSLEGNTSKTVDNPEHIKRIADLEAQLAKVGQVQEIDIRAAKKAGIKVKADGDFEAIEGIGPKISGIIQSDGIKTFSRLSDTSPNHIQTLLDNAGSKYNMAKPGTWPDQANLAANNRWGALKALQDVLDGGVYPDGSKSSDSKSKTDDNDNNAVDSKRVDELERELAQLKQGQAVDINAAKAAGIAIKSDGDFTAIEGIGPKINDLIHDDGIKTFSALSNSSSNNIQKILDNAGPRYQMANPGTWPDQAHLAANNRWSALKALQDVLDGGLYPDGSSSSSDKVKGDEKDQGKRSAKSKTEPAKDSKAESVSTVDSDAAKAAGYKLKAGVAGQHDFSVIEGIGPKINEILHTANIHTYAELASTGTANIQKILDDAGPRYSLADPDTWAAQSDLAADNKWTELKKWQDELDGGKA